MEQKLFTLTRKDLPVAYQAVQSGHAVAQWMLENPSNSWRNNTLVYLSVKDEDHLNMWCYKLASRGYDFSEFREPDIGNEKTSIACYCDGKIFGNLKLMGE